MARWQARMAEPFLSYLSLATRWLEKLEDVKTVLIAIDGLGGSGKRARADDGIALITPP
jgi:hypothetical protein